MMETLPIEVLEIVSQHLTEQDLAACCATNSVWREIFNEDILWRPRCDQSIVEYLKTTICKVEPGFVSPDLEDNSLSPLCVWRMNFMLQNHFFNNWRQGKHVKEDINLTDIDCSDLGDGYDYSYHTFITNDHIIIYMKKRFMLWSVRESSSYICDPLQLQYESSIDVCKPFGNSKLVVVQGLTVQVFKIPFLINQIWPLERTFFIKCSHFELSHSYCHFIITGNFFVHYLKNAIIDVWDLNKGINLKKDYSIHNRNDNCDNYLYDIQLSEKPSNDFLIVMENEFTHLFTINVYSLDNLAFFDFKVNLKLCDENIAYFFCILYDKYVVINNDSAVKIYNYTTSQLLLNVCILSQTLIVNEDFFFTDKKIILQQYNESFWFEVQHSSNLQSLTLFVIDGVKEFTRVTCSKSLRTRGCSYNIFFQNVLQYKNVTEEIEIKRLSGLSRYKLNSICTKLLLKDENLKVISFW